MLKKKKIKLIFASFALLVILVIYYFNSSTTIYFYIVNDNRIEDGSVELCIDSIIIKDKVLKKEWPYKFLEPVIVKPGFSDLSISFDNNFQTSEKLFFYHKTHYIMVSIDYEKKEINLYNTTHFIMYQ